MSERKSIGQILKDIGRLTESDIERALEHQRTHGGLFGEALIELGLLESEELEWSLASQFDLPYIFPDASAIDPVVAGLVSMDWALRHNALPIMREGQRLTLVVDSPLHIDAPTELATRTGCEVELALATPAAIRRVIREVFWGNRTRSMSLANTSAMSLSDFVGKITRARPRQWGISERPDRTVGWLSEAGQQQRFRLSGTVRDDLDQYFDPPLAPYMDQSGRQTWRARLVGEQQALEVTAIVSERALEMSVRTASGTQKTANRMPPSDLLTELRQALSEGVMVVGVEQPDDDLAIAVLTRIPEAVLPAGQRAVFLAVTDEPMQTGLPEMPLASLESEREVLKEFAFDVLIIERYETQGPALRQATELAPLVVVGLVADSGAAVIPEEVDALLSWDPDEAGEGGWCLRLRHEPADHPTT